MVGQLAQFLENPGCIHWEAAKRVVRYLKGTMDHRQAISSFVVLVDRGAVLWLSKKQELVTLSSMEAEYVGTTHAAKELIWFCRLIKEIFRPLIFSTIL